MPTIRALSFGFAQTVCHGRTSHGGVGSGRWLSRLAPLPRSCALAAERRKFIDIPLVLPYISVAESRHNSCSEPSYLAA